MAYEVVMSYHLHMPSYFLGTFTEYPYLHYAVAERWIHSVESRELKVTVCGITMQTAFNSRLSIS